MKYAELAEYFQNVDHFDVKTIEGAQSLRGFVAGMLSHQPWYMTLLFAVREILVWMLGLVKHEKPAGPLRLAPGDIPFEAGRPASFFIVEKAVEDRYWIAITPEDRHLTAWFGVVAESLAHRRTRFHVFTTVRYRHWTGPVYFNLIRPFHHLVVGRMMRAGITGGLP